MALSALHKTARAVLDFVLTTKPKTSPALLYSDTTTFTVKEKKDDGTPFQREVKMSISIFVEDNAIKEKIVNNLYYPEGKSVPAINFNQLCKSTIDDLRPWLPGKPYFGDPNKKFEFEEVEAGCSRYMSQLLKTSSCCELENVKVTYSLTIV